MNHVSDCIDSHEIVSVSVNQNESYRLKIKNDIEEWRKSSIYSVNKRNRSTTLAGDDDIEYYYSQCKQTIYSSKDMETLLKTPKKFTNTRTKGNGNVSSYHPCDFQLDQFENDNFLTEEKQNCSSKRLKRTTTQRDFASMVKLNESASDTFKSLIQFVDQAHEA